MKNFLSIILLLFLGTNVIAQSFHNVPFAKNFSLTSGPTFNRPIQNGNNAPIFLSGLATSVYYTTYSFRPSTTGSYTFRESTFTGDGGDSYGFLYMSPFNPASPLTNVLIGDDDDGPGSHYEFTITLTAGVSYTLVSTTFNNSITGTGSTFVSGPPGAVLPVQWMSVTGTVNQQDKGIINWKVQEDNVDRYVIEKSINGVDYFALTTVPSKGNGINSYEVVDPLPLTKQTFYRILQYDLNREASYSSIIRLDVKQSSINIYPNPVKRGELLQVSVGSRLLQTNARLINISGVQLQTIKIRNQTFSVDLSTYSPGTYLLQFENGNSYKIVRE
jgi:hypothetical protein